MYKKLIFFVVGGRIELCFYYNAMWLILSLIRNNVFITFIRNLCIFQLYYYLISLKTVSSFTTVLMAIMNSGSAYPPPPSLLPPPPPALYAMHVSYKHVCPKDLYH